MRAAVTRTANRNRNRLAAFAIPDAAALTLALALLGALMLAGIGASRHHARAAAGQAQLRWIAGVTRSYAADNADKLWGLSWRAGHTETQFRELRDPPTDFQAVQNQATDIIKRRATNDFAKTIAWLPTVRYSHLPLTDYLDLDLPAVEFVSPEDAVRIPWARDRHAFEAGEFLPLQPTPLGRVDWWPFSSSYELPVQLTWDPLTGADAIRPAFTHRTFHLGEGAAVSQRRMADFAFPSQKVHLHATEQWAPQRIFFGDPAAQVAMLMADGSAAINRTADANLGWNVLNPPKLDAYERYRYDPAEWEAPAPSVEPEDYVPGLYRFTRGGPAGRDFGGPEIDTR